MAEAIAYYGDYQPAVAKYVAAWFRARGLDERTVAEMWAETIKALSSSFRSPPDVAALETAHRAVKARDDHRPDRVRLPLAQPDMVDRAIAAEYLAAMASAMIGRRDPRTDPEVLRILREVDDAYQVQRSQDDD